MTRLVLAALFVLSSVPALAQDEQTCEQVRRELETKMRAAGEKDFYLDVLPAGKTGNARVVGSCDQGKMRIVYRRS